MIRRPPRSTLDRSSAASDVYKRQVDGGHDRISTGGRSSGANTQHGHRQQWACPCTANRCGAVSYTHLRAHETVLDLVCRLLLEKKKKTTDYGADGTQ